MLAMLGPVRVLQISIIYVSNSKFLSKISCIDFCSSIFSRLNMLRGAKFYFNIERRNYPFHQFITVSTIFISCFCEFDNNEQGCRKT